MSLNIFLDSATDKLIVKASLKGNKILQHEITITDELKIISIVYSLLECTDQIFYQLLPLSNINIHISDFFFQNKKLISSIKIFISILKKTNSLAQTFLEQNNKYFSEQSQKNTLVLNITNADILVEIYNRLKKNNDHTIYFKGGTKFNAFTRKKLDSKQNPLTSQEILEYVITNNVNKIITLNFELLSRCLNDHEYLLPILKILKIEFITLYWDFYEMQYTGHILKNIFIKHHNIFYSMLPSMLNLWDKYLNFHNVIYFPIAFTRSTNKTNTTLKSPFSILCCANCRLVNLFQGNALSQVIAAIEICEHGNIFYDFQFWCHAILYFVLHNSSYTKSQKLKIRTDLLNIHFNGVSILKYHALQAIPEKYSVELYGDICWKKIFPKYYQNKYLTSLEIDSKIFSGDFLYLQLNSIFSYPEANPIVSTTIKGGAPMIGFPAVVKIPELEGFSNIEYSSPKQLENILNNIQSNLNSEQLKSSMAYHKNKMDESYNFFFNGLISSNHEENTVFMSYCNRHFSIFKKRSDDYIKQYHDLLDHYIRSYILEDKAFPLEDSKLIEKPYYRKILQLHSHQLKALCS